MIPVISLKSPKSVIKKAFPLVVGLLLIGFLVHQLGVDVSNLNLKFQDAISRLNSTATVERISNGASILPQNVEFKFLNVQGKLGTPKEILEENMALYDKVLLEEVKEPKDFNIENFRPPLDPGQYEHAKATIVALVRNNEVNALRRTMHQFEERFNKKFQYPYTFLNDQPFTEAFKNRVRRFTSAPIEFVEISKNQWDKPSWLDLEKQKQGVKYLEDENVAYAAKESYHNMCRFYSREFFKVPELQKYKYYWRIEPNVRFYTDVNYDVFKYLEATKKVYGFTIALYDIEQSVELLWPETIDFLNTGDNYKYVNPNGAFQWLVEDLQNPHKTSKAKGYLTCHFWSNFEIADMDFFRQDAYMKWAEHLELTGKYYYERWGDAPVHLLGVSLFADKSKVHWFRDIGYWHAPYHHCPNTESTRGCKIGKFADSELNNDQNCMASWLQFEAGNLAEVY